MLSAAHRKVVELARGALPPALGPAIRLLWEGVLTGATAPDELRVFWDPDEQEDRIHRILMHRCFMDSDDERDRGCPLQIERYATGTISFMDAYAAGELGDAYDDETFPVNAGLFLGFVSHHVADLHTPVHVGKTLSRDQVGYTRSGLHARVEADLDRAAREVDDVAEHVGSPMDLSRASFEAIAQAVHDRHYVTLPDLYRPLCPPEVRSARLQPCIRGAACVTADAWTTVLGSLGPAARALVGIAG